jgi:beta propeller repeat protein
MNLPRLICPTCCTRTGMRQFALACLEAMILAATAFSAPWKPIPVYPSAGNQTSPVIDGVRVVWQQYVTSQGVSDWDVYSADITNPKKPILTIVSEFSYDQTSPAISGTVVAFQDNSAGDWDIYIHDLSLAANTDLLVTDQLYDQINPAISGNFLLWQDNSAGDCDIYLGDITQTDSLRSFNLTPYEYDQQNPAVDREWVVWEDNFVWDQNPDGIWDLYGADVIQINKPVEYLFGGFSDPQQRGAISGHYVVWQQYYTTGGDWDVYAEDVSDPANPKLIPIAVDATNAINPAISGNLIVWQDDRNGDWDIYGYNLDTRREFLISDAQPNQTVFSDQTSPAISGTRVVWEDNLNGKTNIYLALLSGPDIATCSNPPLGDANGDCVVDLSDLAQFSQYWLSCGLDPVEACP